MRYKIRPYSPIWWLKNIGQAIALLMAIVTAGASTVILGGCLWK